MAIIKYRRMLRAAIAALKDGKEDALPMRNGTDPATLYGPISNDTIGDKEQWREVSAKSDAARRAACSDWDATV